MRASLDLTYALMIDGAGGMVSREEVIAAVDEQLAEVPWLDPATWGTGARAAAGHRAMMALFPAAPPRE